jgi:hypothetical protein
LQTRARAPTALLAGLGRATPGQDCGSNDRSPWRDDRTSAGAGGGRIELLTRGRPTRAHRGLANFLDACLLRDAVFRVLDAAWADTSRSVGLLVRFADDLVIRIVNGGSRGRMISQSICEVLHIQRSRRGAMLLASHRGNDPPMSRLSACPTVSPGRPVV